MHVPCGMSCPGWQLQQLQVCNLSDKNAVRLSRQLHAPSLPAQLVMCCTQRGLIAWLGKFTYSMHTLLVHTSLRYIWKLKLAVWLGRQARVVQLGEPKSEEHAVSCMAFSLQASHLSS